MLQTHRRTLILVVGSGCALLALIVVAGFLYTSIQTESVSVKSAEVSIATLTDKEKDLINAKNGLEGLSKEIDTLNQAFLTEESFVTFLKLLETIGQKSGVLFRAEKADLPQSRGGRAELSIVVHGDYASLVKFFSLLDQVPYAGIVDRVTITPENTKNSLLIAQAHYVIFNFVSQ